MCSCRRPMESESPTLVGAVDVPLRLPRNVNAIGGARAVRSSNAVDRAQFKFLEKPDLVPNVQEEVLMGFSQKEIKATLSFGSQSFGSLNMPCSDIHLTGGDPCVVEDEDVFDSMV